MCMCVSKYIQILNNLSHDEKPMFEIQTNAMHFVITNRV